MSRSSILSEELAKLTYAKAERENQAITLINGKPFKAITLRKEIYLDEVYETFKRYHDAVSTGGITYTFEEWYYKYLPDHIIL